MYLQYVRGGGNVREMPRCGEIYIILHSLFSTTLSSPRGESHLTFAIDPPMSLLSRTLIAASLATACSSMVHMAPHLNKISAQRIATVQMAEPDTTAAKGVVVPTRMSPKESIAPRSKFARFRRALPHGGDELDREILKVAVPSAASLMVIPIVGAVDTYWVGRMGDALALAGQGAANQVFFSAFFLIAFIPTITAPLVAKAAGGGDLEGARRRVCEALWLASILGGLGTLLLALFPTAVLGVVMPAGAPAMACATSYLRLRSVSLVPALVTSVGYAAFRGMLDNVTPLKVSLASNLMNLLLDPLLIFGAQMGVAGAALATAASEVFSGACHGWLLLKRRLLSVGQLLTPPSFHELAPLLQGGAAMLLRQAALNIAFVAATRRTQAMDPSGVSAAAYAITNQVYSLGVVVMLAMQASGATLVPSALARATDGGVRAARKVADRLIGWSTLVALSIAAMQFLAMPYLTPLFTPLAEVRAAIAAPAFASALVALTNGPLFAGEGIMMGVGAFKELAMLTSVGVGVMVGGILLSAKLGLGVASVWYSLLGFHVVQLIGTMLHHLKWGPLAAGRREAEDDAAGAAGGEDAAVAAAESKPEAAEPVLATE